MKQDINAKLEELRKQLTEGEEAWGPSSDVTTAAAEDSEAGEGGAENASDATDAFDAYVMSIVETTLEEYELEPDDAAQMVFDVISNMIEQGDLEDIPSEDDSAGIAAWVGKAKTMDLGGLVLAVFDGMSDEVDEEEEVAED